MKKRLEAILSLSLILSIVSALFPLSAAAASTKSISWNEYITGHEVGFFDNSGAATIEALSDLGVCLRGEEWVAYKISDLEAGEYVLSATRSSTNQLTISVSVDEEERLPRCVVAPTGAYTKQLESDIGVIQCSGKPFVLKIKNAGSATFYMKGLRLESQKEKAKKEAYYSQPRPYKMSYLPCIIEAENFDCGAAGSAYYTLDEKNSGGAYRTAVGVDIYENGKGYAVSLSPGEWLSYTFRVDFPGNYELLANCADNSECSSLRFYINQYEVIRNLSYPALTMNMSEVSAGTLYFPQGVYTLRVKCMEGGLMLDRLRFRRTTSKGTNVTDTAALRTWADSQEADEAIVVLEPQRHQIAKELYVSADKGSDNGDGSSTKPFKTIAAAQEAVRGCNQDMQGDIVVHLSGCFYLENTLNFTEKDSGTNGKLVIWQGEDGTVIHGGKKVTGWEKVEGTGLYKATLPGQDGFRQLYIGENRGVRARSKWLYYPLEEYVKPVRSTTLYSETDGYVLSGRDFPHDFAKPGDMEFIWLPSWRNVRVPVESITRRDNGDLVAAFVQPAFDMAFEGSSSISMEHPFYIENAPELLDEPGEWYFNTDTKELFYYPVEGEDMQTIDCYIPRTEGLLTVNGTDIEHKVKNIMFEGISFRYGAWERPTNMGFATIQAEEMLSPEGGSTTDTHSKYPTRIVPSQIEVNYGEGIHFVNNEFAHLGSVALSYNHATCSSMAVGNIFDDVSASAVTVSDWHFAKQDPLEKFCRKVTLANNLLRRVGVEYMTPAITAYYVNNLRISHNDIQDTPYSGISLGWGWGRGVENCAYNHIENNRIENVLYKLMDGGHIYTLDPMQGTVISGNYLIKSGEWKGGIYHDNASAYITTRNNVFDCYKWLKITWHNIHDNTAYNNYSDTPFVVTYPDNNSISEATGKINGEWPEAAKKIIANAGLDSEHRGLLDRYAKKGAVRNAELKRLPYDTGAGTMIPAGEHVQGAEGEAFHEVVGYDSGPNRKGEPDIYESYNGTGHRYLMATAQGEWTKYKVNVPEDGSYDIFLKIAVTSDAVRAGIEIDGRVVEAQAKLHKTCDDYSVFEEQHVATVDLTAGEHVLKVEHAVGNFGFWSVRVAKTGEQEKARNDGFRPEVVSAVLH